MYQSPLLSPTARAILSGMNRNPNYAASAQQTGLANLDEALRLKAMADEVSGAGNTQAPPPGNVMDQLKMKVQAALSGQPSMPPMPPQGMPPQQGGMPPQGMPPQGMPPQGGMPPQQPPMDPRMAAGIATLPAPNMAPQGMAAGGIVAFEDGGDVYGYDNSASAAGLQGPYRDDFAPAIAEDRLTDSAPLQGAGEEAPPDSSYGPLIRSFIEKGLSGKPRSIEDYMKEEEDINKKAGRGSALEKRIENLSKRAGEEKELSAKDLEDLKKQSKSERAAAFFDAAASGNKTFLGALGEGFGGAAKAKSSTAKEERALAREQRKAQQNLEDATLAAQESQENLRYDTSRRAQERADADKARLDAAADRSATLAANVHGTDAQIAIARAKALAENEKLGTDKVIADYIQEADRLRREGKMEEADALDARAKEFIGLKAGVPTKESLAINAALQKDQTQLRIAVKGLSDPKADVVAASNAYLRQVAGSLGISVDDLRERLGAVNTGDTVGGAAGSQGEVSFGAMNR